MDLNVCSRRPLKSVANLHHLEPLAVSKLDLQNLTINETNCGRNPIDSRWPSTTEPQSTNEQCPATTTNAAPDAECNGSTCSAMSDCSNASDEIPVWVRGEPRWISGITDETTCDELVEALVKDDIPVGGEQQAARCSDYVITERWRRVEQILDGRTNILNIWNSWGEAQSEVRLSLRRIESRQSNPIECDSGRGSPTGSINSGIVRRRKHRALKTTPTWATHAQTMYPKSQKATIEKLMKLILEQGETIQHQLTKLRDREMEITKIEEDRHRMREREYGKNYLLEAYLNGLHEAAIDKEMTQGNSDSGVHTEDTTSTDVTKSPINDDKIDGGFGRHCDDDEDDDDEEEDDDVDEDEVDDVDDAVAMVDNEVEYVHTGKEQRRSTTNIIPKQQQYLKSSQHNNKRKQRSSREMDLLKEHEYTKKFSEILLTRSSRGSVEMEETDSSSISLLEKIIVINKHVQREEELIVRLSAKIRRFESEDPSLSEHQIHEALTKVNTNIDSTSTELERMELELQSSGNLLNAKSDILEKLCRELESTEEEIIKNQAIPSQQLANAVAEENALENHCIRQQFHHEIIIDEVALENPSNEVSSARNYDHVTAPNFDGIPAMPLMTPQYLHQMNPCDYVQKSTCTNNPANSLAQTIQPPAQFACYNGQPLNGGIMRHHNMMPPQYAAISRHNMMQELGQPPTQFIQQQQQTADQRNVNLASMKGAAGKLGHKRLMIAGCAEADSNSDTGLSSIGEDMTQLGTLV